MEPNDLTPAQVALREVTPEPVDENTARLGANFEKLLQLVVDEMPEEFSTPYVMMMMQFAEDQEYLGASYLGLIRAPAARVNHHAFEGGLVAHYLEMWDIWQKLRDGYLREPYVTDCRVLQGIIAHDLHKGYCTYVLQEENPWTVAYGKHEITSLLNPTLYSCWMLTQAGIPFDVEQLHALAQSEGGWSDQSRIRHTSVLAKVVYLLDELSANVAARIANNTLLERDRPVRDGYMSLPEDADHG